MKRIVFFNVILCSVLLFNSCDTPLTEFKTKNEDEKQIVDLLQKYTDSRNSLDIKGIRSTFHDDGIYYKGMGEN